MRRLALIAIVLATTSAFASSADALRKLYLTFDSSTAVDLGRRWGAAEPDDLEQRAWYIVNLNRVDSLAARRMAEAMPDGPWKWLALAYAYRDDLDRVDDNKAIAAKLANETGDDFAVARALALNSTIDPKAAIAVLDEQLPRAQDRVRILVAKGETVASLPGKEEEAFALFDEALKLDPSNVSALLQAGFALRSLRRRDESKAMFERAAQASPYIMATQVPKAAELDALVAERGDDPYILALAARGFRALKMDDRVCELQDRIMREAPASQQALSVMMSRPRNRATWRDVIDYPLRRDPELIAESAIAMLRDDKGPKLSDDEAVALMHMIPVTAENTMRLLLGAQQLADRKIDLAYAESVARKSADLNERYLLPLEMDSDAESRDRATRSSRALVHDTIGWVLLAQGNVKDAQKELTAARSLYPESALSAYHLGRLFEGQKMFTKAEQLYLEAISMQFSAGLNPGHLALADLYRRRHGSLAGFEAYRKRMTSTSAAASRERVLASRIAKPKSAPHFRLKSLDGKTISLGDLKGKVTVLNFWGVWCGWCVREMPDFATLARRYAGDPYVRIVTVDTDDDPDTVKKWMAEKKYDFPVLLDDGWARRSGISAFPTTWFLDKQGRIAFKKIGWTEKLVDQFSWRIDVLKE